jgi:hypothetical protein
MSSFPYTEVSRFIGMDTTRNKLSIPSYSQDGTVMAIKLSLNENFLYMSTGGLESRGGGDKLATGPVATDVVYGLANYQNDSDSQYLVSVHGSKLYYYDSGWVDFGISLTANKRMRFAGAGYGPNRALYGVNENDSVIKVAMSGGVPVASAVSSSPTTAKYLKLHKNRLFWIDNNDTLGYTDINAFDTFDIGNNFLYVSPGVDGNLQAMEIWGDSLFIFKERGVYILPNAADDSTEWKILRTDALTGTQSPDTVVATKAGIYFLSTDNFVRMLSPNISFSSAEYTMAGSGSPIVSYAIQEDITSLLDSTTKSRAVAVSFNDLYILSFQSVNNAATYNDLTYFADTSKLMEMANIEAPQPFWGTFTNFNYDFYALQYSGTQLKLYGSKGAIDGTVDGDVHETLNPSINNDDGAAIRPRAITAWFAPGGQGLYKKFRQIYFTGDTENWFINLIFNAYKLGTVLPGDGEGAQDTFTTGDASGGIVGTGVVGTAVVSQVGVSSTKYRLSLKGHFFKAEFSNLNPDEFIRINKMVIYYRPIKQG